MATVKKTMMMMKKSSPKKAQTGKTVMQKLKMKYPDADTSAAGDTRFQEFNAYAPKKELKRIADTDKAFDKKYGKGKPAKNKMGGKVKKAQAGITTYDQSPTLSKIPAAGAMRKTKMKERSADGNYMAKTVTRETPAGMRSSTKIRRTGQGILRGAPKMNKYKMGGKMSKMSKMSKKK